MEEEKQVGVRENKPKSVYSKGSVKLTGVRLWEYLLYHSLSLRSLIFGNCFTVWISVVMEEKDYRIFLIAFFFSFVFFPSNHIKKNQFHYPN